MRRLIRQYGRQANAVFPIGAYLDGINNPNLSAPIPTYGTDVSLTLPTTAGAGGNSPGTTNPNYKGCLAPPSTA
jgi:hypothetical protein